MCDHVHAITRLVHRYPELVDQGDLDGVAELFRHATIRAGEHEFRGIDELRALWEGAVRRHDDGATFTKHLVTNVVVDVAADEQTASARSYITVIQAVPPDFPLQVIASSRHFDEFERVDGEWRFRLREDVRDLTGDLSQHVR